jgi:cytochrome c553
MLLCLSQDSYRAQVRMPPAWPYAQPQLDPGVVPPQAAVPQTPAYTPPPAVDPNNPASALRQAEGSTLRFTQQQINYGYGPPDWFPDSHPPMPDIVAHGKRNEARACGLCHLADGRGRPENAPLQSLPVDYFKMQIHDFQTGVRHSADPRKANTLEMETIAKALTDAEIDGAARYFSSIEVPKYIRVVETGMVPTTRVQGEIYFATDDGKSEPIGVRIIETPENGAETLLRNPRSGFIAYVPIGSVAKGEVLVKTGGDGKTIPCAACHGDDLVGGVGPIPNIAGRSPSYLARQIYDFKLGTRHGTQAPAMQPVVAELTDEDIVDVVAYVSSLTPSRVTVRHAYGTSR